MCLNLGGSHLGDCLAEDPDLAFALASKVLDSGLASQARIAFVYALLGSSCKPDYVNSVVPGLEYDLLTVAMETDNDGLLAATLFNVGNAGNYDVIQVARDWLVLRPQDARNVQRTVEFMKSVESSEKNWRENDAARAAEYWRDSRDSHAALLHDLGLERRHDMGSMFVIATALGDRGRLDLVWDLRSQIDTTRFSQDDLMRFDEMLRNGGFHGR